jgi:SP family galactose:H+ symporter-like MFS transporter
MISMYQLMITIGIRGLSFRYRFQLQRRMALDARRDHHPAVLLLIGVFFLPDSPRWFAAKRFVDAERAAAPA